MPTSQDTHPKVSILLATRDRPHLIGKTIDSILAQTFKRFELIIIDGSPTDDTKRLISKYSDVRIVYVHKKHYNLPKSRNWGLKASGAKYIAYCDDDTLYLPQHLEKLLNFLQAHPEIDMAYSNALFYFPHEKPVLFGLDFSQARLKTCDYIFVPSVLHKKNIIKRVGYFDEKLTALCPWDFWMRLSDTFKIAHLPLATVKHIYYEDTPSLMASLKSRHKDTGAIARRYIKKMKNSDALKAYINDCSFGIIKNLIDNRRIAYANQLANNFYRRVKNYQTLACLGLILLARGDFNKACLRFKDSAKKMPKDWQSFAPWAKENILSIKVYLAKAHYFLNNNEQAIKISEEILRSDRKNLEAKLQLALCFIREKYYKKAIALLVNCGFNPAIYNLRGYCFFKKRQFKLAIREFKNALILEPLLPMYHYNLSMGYYYSGKYKLSQNEYERAVSLSRPNL